MRAESAVVERVAPSNSTPGLSATAAACASSGGASNNGRRAAPHHSPPAATPSPSPPSSVGHRHSSVVGLGVAPIPRFSLSLSLSFVRSSQDRSRVSMDGVTANYMPSQRYIDAAAAAATVAVVVAAAAAAAAAAAGYNPNRRCCLCCCGCRLYC